MFSGTNKKPYEQLSDQYRIYGAITRGDLPIQELDRDRIINESLWGCIKRCWSIQPGSRPSASVVKSYIKYSARVSPVEEKILRHFLLSNVEKGFTGDFVDMDVKTRSIIALINNIGQSLKIGNGAVSNNPTSSVYQSHIKIFCKFIQKSRSLAIQIVESCNEFQSVFLPLAYNIAQRDIAQFSELFELYNAKHLDTIIITAYDSNSFDVFRQKIGSFAYALHTIWGPFPDGVLEVKKRKDELDREIALLNKELEVLEGQPSTSSIPSSRVTFMDTIANSFNWTSSKTQSPAEIRERIRDILTEKQQLDNHPGYNEARVRLDAISAIKRNINQIVDVLELVWKPAVTDCRSIRNLFERIKQARSPELIQHELRSANTLYDFLADSLDAYAIGMKDIEEQLQNLM